MICDMYLPLIIYFFYTYLFDQNGNAVLKKGLTHSLFYLQYMYIVGPVIHFSSIFLFILTVLYII